MIAAVGKRVESWIDRHFIGVTTTTIFLLFFVIYFAPNIFITIPAGHGGALWLRFFQGTVMNFHYDEGTKIVFPWDKIFIYDLRVQQESEQFDMLTKEGLQISVNVTLRFRLRREGLSAITAYAGPNFVKSLVMPSVGAVVRLKGAKYNLQDIFSTDRHLIELDILKSLSEVVKNLIPGELHQGAEIVILDFWFRGIQLPPSLQIGHRSEAGSEPARRTVCLHPSTRGAGEGTQDHRGPGHQGFPGHRLAGHFGELPALEGHRCHAQAGQFTECQDRGDRRQGGAATHPWTHGRHTRSRGRRGAGGASLRGGHHPAAHGLDDDAFVVDQGHRGRDAFVLEQPAPGHPRRVDRTARAQSRYLDAGRPARFEIETIQAVSISWRPAQPVSGSQARPSRASNSSAAAGPSVPAL